MNPTRILITMTKNPLHSHFHFSSITKFGNIIGIDLGTSTSTASIIRDNTLKLISFQNTQTTIPSIVSFTPGGEIRVGEKTKQNRYLNYENTVFGVKRLMGKKFDDEIVRNYEKYVPYRIGKNRDNGNVLVQVRGKYYTPEQITAFILSKIKQSAEICIGYPVTRAVLTVPATFTDSQRHATLNAAKIAGLDVERLMNESTAVALIYAMKNRKKPKHTIAVYDFGGGKFDFSIFDANEGRVQVRGHHGNDVFGGEDVDSIIQRYLLQQAINQFTFDPSSDKQTYYNLRLAAQDTKIKLSQQDSSQITIPHFIMTPIDIKQFKTTMTRIQFDHLIDKFIKQTITLCEEGMKDIGIRKDRIDQVILIGGMTHIPKVQTLVQDYFGKIPNIMNDGTVVALGAAIQGGIIKGDIKMPQVVDITCSSVVTSFTGHTITKIINKNTPFLIKYPKIFTTTVIGQKQIIFQVYQGEKLKAQGNRYLGDVKLTGIQASASGPSQIQVIFQIDGNGILKLSTTDRRNNKQLQIEILKTGYLTEEEILKMIIYVKQLKIEQQRRQQLNDIKIEMSKMAQIVNEQLKNFDGKLKKKQVLQIDRAMSTLQKLRVKQIKYDDLSSIIRALQDVHKISQIIRLAAENQK